MSSELCVQSSGLYRTNKMSLCVLKFSLVLTLSQYSSLFYLTDKNYISVNHNGTQKQVFLQPAGISNQI